MAELKYLLDGIRLHAQEFVYKVTNRLNDKYYISFSNIPNGLKAEKILKKNKLAVKEKCIKLD